MKISELIGAFGEAAKFSFEGDQSSEFFGLHLSARQTVKNRLFVLVDDNWPMGPQRMFSEARRGGRPAVRLKTAFKNGAAAAVVPTSLADKEAKRVLKGRNAFFVDDSHLFAWEVLRAVRARFAHRNLTAITGAAGKSTTQGMLAHALRSIETTESGVLAPTGNQNLYWSSVWQASSLEQHEHIVIEVAASACGVFQKFDVQLPSDVAIVTSISEAHMKGKDGLREIAKRKAAIFDGTPPGGTAVINLDTPHSELLVKSAMKAGRQVITYGESPDAAVRLRSYDHELGEVVASFGIDEVTYRVGAAGKHMALNSLAVLATLRAYRIENWQIALRSLASFGALAGRGEVSQLSIAGSPEVTLIDESFNANPASMNASLESLAAFPLESTGRRVAFLGDMLELGDHSRRAHEELSVSVENARPDLLIIFGEEMSALRDVLEARNSVQFKYFANFENAKSALPSLLLENDVLLVKASGSTGLKTWIRELVQ